MLAIIILLLKNFTVLVVLTYFGSYIVIDNINLNKL